MAPKKAEDPPPEEEEDQTPVEPPEAVIEQKCFRSGGQVYYGDSKAGWGETEGRYIRHGFGRQVSTAQSVHKTAVTLGIYEGNWDDDVMTGHGTYTWKDGSTYEGAFLDGKMHGFGRFEWPEGSSYEGIWSKGQITGQGRFDSRFDGSFLQGKFHRNCFQRHDGRWVNVTQARRIDEQNTIRSGDCNSITLKRCSNQQELSSAIAAIDAEGMVPFVIAEDALDCSPVEWMSSGAIGTSQSATVNIRSVAVALRRQNDWSRPLYDALQAALVSGERFTIVFEDPKDVAESERDPPPKEGAFGFVGSAPQAFGQTGGSTILDEEVSQPLPLPDNWRLSRFFDPFVFPLEVFHPRLFNGRDKSRQFLPEELRQDSHGAIPSPTPPGEVDGDERGAAAEGGSAAASPPPMGDGEDAAQELKTENQVVNEMPERIVYGLISAVVALGRVPSDLPTEEVLSLYKQKFGQHCPLHRTTLVLLTARSYLAS